MGPVDCGTKCASTRKGWGAYEMVSFLFGGLE